MTIHIAFGVVNIDYNIQRLSPNMQLSVAIYTSARMTSGAEFAG